jgi:integrase
LGHIEESGNWFVVRYWKDVEGVEKRQRIRERICPISGPGKLSASERERRAKEIVAASGADTVEHFERVVRSIHGTTFREQAKVWLNQVKSRKRKPVAPSTTETWESNLEKWINPVLGDTPLDAVNNLAMKGFVARMVSAGLSPKTVTNISQVVKMVVASAIDEQGEEIYPRKWNHEFIDMPVVDKHKQRRPSFTGEMVTGIVAAAEKETYRMLFVLCAAGGLRLGEALGIDVRNISPDCRTIQIVQKAWKGKIHSFLKTPNGVRDIDLHPSVAAMLKAFVGQRTSGLLFIGRTRKQLHQSNILRRVLHPILEGLGHPKCGCHAFRRFRLTWLRRNNVPKDLERFWMGHADEEVGDLYSKLKNDVEFRREVAEKIGLGFEISVQVRQQNCSFGPIGPNQEKGPVGEAQQALVNQ